MESRIKRILGLSSSVRSSCMTHIKSYLHVVYLGRQSFEPDNWVAPDYGPLWSDAEQHCRKLQSFWRNILLPPRHNSSIVQMEAVGSSETLVAVYQATSDHMVTSLKNVTWVLTTVKASNSSIAIPCYSKVLSVREFSKRKTHISLNTKIRWDYSVSTSMYTRNSLRSLSSHFTDIYFGFSATQYVYVEMNQAAKMLGVQRSMPVDGSGNISCCFTTYLFTGIVPELTECLARSIK